MEPTPPPAGNGPSPDDNHAPAPTEPPSEPAPSSVRAAGSWRARWLVMLGIVVVSVGIDQWSKQWAQTDLQHRPRRSITVVPGYVGLNYVRNSGAAWGFLSRADPNVRKPFFVGVSLLAMLFILVLFRRLESGQRWLAVALSMVMGGAVGNFIDRVRQGYVVDFLDVHLRHHFYWPKFNVADIAITVGVVMLLLEMIFGHHGHPAAAATEPAAQTEPLADVNGEAAADSRRGEAE